ncbi:MAG: hypothetical protein ACKOC5_08840 [Chloroflexota bacterium]
MAAYCDHTYYTGVFKGAAIAAADFPRLALRASEVIDQLTLDRAAAVVTAATDTATIDKIKLATCAVAEQIQIGEQGGPVQSERVGSYSVTYAAQHTQQQQLQAAVKRYLWNTGLLYRGPDAD